jgi:hypothetical protein
MARLAEGVRKLFFAALNSASLLKQRLEQLPRADIRHEALALFNLRTVSCSSAEKKMSFMSLNGSRSSADNLLKRVTSERSQRCQ